MSFRIISEVNYHFVNSVLFILNVCSNPYSEKFLDQQEDQEPNSAEGISLVLVTGVFISHLGSVRINLTW